MPHDSALGDLVVSDLYVDNGQGYEGRSYYENFLQPWDRLRPRGVTPAQRTSPRSISGPPGPRGPRCGRVMLFYPVAATENLLIYEPSGSGGRLMAKPS